MRTSPQRRLVQHVVVNQRSGVDHLRHLRQLAVLGRQLAVSRRVRATKSFEVHCPRLSPVACAVARATRKHSTGRSFLPPPPLEPKICCAAACSVGWRAPTIASRLAFSTARSSFTGATMASNDSCSAAGDGRRSGGGASAGSGRGAGRTSPATAAGAAVRLPRPPSDAERSAPGRRRRRGGGACGCGDVQGAVGAEPVPRRAHPAGPGSWPVHNIDAAARRRYTAARWSVVRRNCAQTVPLKTSDSFDFDARRLTSRARESLLLLVAVAETLVSRVSSIMAPKRKPAAAAAPAAAPAAKPAAKPRGKAAKAAEEAPVADVEEAEEKDKAPAKKAKKAAAPAAKKAPAAAKKAPAKGKGKAAAVEPEAAVEAPVAAVAAAKEEAAPAAAKKTPAKATPKGAKAKAAAAAAAAPEEAAKTDASAADAADAAVADAAEAPAAAGVADAAGAPKKVVHVEASKECDVFRRLGHALLKDHLGDGFDVVVNGDKKARTLAALALFLYIFTRFSSRARAPSW